MGLDDRTVGERYEDQLKYYCPHCFHRNKTRSVSRCENCREYMPFRWNQEQLEKVAKHIEGPWDEGE